MGFFRGGEGQKIVIELWFRISFFNLQIHEHFQNLTMLIGLDKN